MPRGKPAAKKPSSSSSTSSYSTRSRRGAKKDGSIETSESEPDNTVANATSTAPTVDCTITKELAKAKGKGRGRGKKKGTESESESEVEATTTSAATATIISGTTVPHQANETITTTTTLVPPQTPQVKRRADVDETITKENSDPNATVSQARVKERLESILEEFDIEVESRSQAMHAEAEKLAHQLRSAFNVELMKIPKKWRSMTMREFTEVHKGDWNLLTGKTSSSIAPTPQKTAAPTKITIKLDAGIELDALSDAAKLNAVDKEQYRKRLLELQGQLNSVLQSLK